jgi:PKD repeat protein
MGCLLEGQLGGIVTDQISSLPISGAAVKVSQGNIEKNTTSTQADGSYLLPLEPGDYSVMVSAASYLTSTTDSVQINPYHTTNLNVALCQAVQDINFTFSPARPHLDETVTFTGTARSGRSPISFSWDFGDGSNGSGQVVTHTYNEDGGFLVGLTADNACQTPASSPLLPVYVDAELLYLPFMGGG